MDKSDIILVLAFLLVFLTGFLMANSVYAERNISYGWGIPSGYEYEEYFSNESYNYDYHDNIIVFKSLGDEEFKITKKAKTGSYEVEIKNDYRASWAMCHLFTWC